MRRAASPSTHRRQVLWHRRPLPSGVHYHWAGRLMQASRTAPCSRQQLRAASTAAHLAGRMHAVRAGSSTAHLGTNAADTRRSLVTWTNWWMRSTGRMQRLPGADQCWVSGAPASHLSLSPSRRGPCRQAAACRQPVAACRQDTRSRQPRAGSSPRTLCETLAGLLAD